MGIALNTPNKVHGDEESFYSVFQTVAESRELNKVALSSLNFSYKEESAPEDFFRRVIQDNQKRLASFSGEDLAMVVYANYLGVLLQDLKKQQSYLNTLERLQSDFPIEKLQQIFPKSFKVAGLVERSLDRFLKDKLSTQFTGSTESALGKVLNISNLRFHPQERLPQLNEMNSIEIPESYLGILRGKSQNE
ncbi:MAG: hypothetical protein SNF33_02820 [Candidatus Algichlamydia australiensis]|nr:hypothetical protein [Chlamydiales bacterium]